MIKLLSLALSGICAASVSAAGAPHAIRVFRGVKLGSLSSTAFHGTLNKSFIPALAATHAKNGAVGYVPVLPPALKRPSVADEYALVVYESAEANQIARATPEGEAYAASHWTIFDRERSKSGSAEPLGSALVAETPYDVLQRPVDWQSGHVTFFLGARRDGVASKKFLEGLREHVADVVKTFGPSGLDGYVLVANDDTELAFQRWKDEESAERAFATSAGQAIGRGARELLAPVQFSVAKPFDPRQGLRPGEAANVRFLRRGAEFDNFLTSRRVTRLLEAIPGVVDWEITRSGSDVPTIVIWTTNPRLDEMRARVIEQMPALAHYPIDVRLDEPQPL